MGLSGSKTTANPKQKNGSARMKAKKQKRNEKKVSHAHINDWSSDDSAEPVPMQDQPVAMSDSDEANADKAASVDKHAVALAVKQKKKQQGEQQSAGHKRKKKGKGGNETHSKRKSGGSAKRHAHAKHARASDWTTDDSSDAQFEKIIDNLEAMSESDADSQEGNRPNAVKHTVASSLGKQGQKQVAEKKSLAQQSSSAERDPHRVLAAEEEEEDWGQPAAMSGDEAQPAQQAKRKGRLRKARASPGPTQHAAAGSEADDLMVDLEDDIPDIEMEAERHSISREAADRLSDESLLHDEWASEGAGQKTMQTGKPVGAGSQDSETEAARRAGKRLDK